MMNPDHRLNAGDDQERLQRIYDQEKAREYRLVLDVIYGKTLHCSIVSQIIKEICVTNGSDRLDVLDLGCGTGRYFKAIGKVRSLTGVDLSIHMIEEAKIRVESDKAICQSTTFECANITSLNIPREAYDLILSIGTLGELCPLTKELIGKVVAGLRPGGIFLFTVFDTVQGTVRQIVQQALSGHAREAETTLWSLVLLPLSYNERPPAAPIWVRGQQTVGEEVEKPKG
jgi:SAM-dependent methyltransferase